MKEKIVKVNKHKSWFFEKINKTDEYLGRFMKKKDRRIKSTKSRHEKGEVTTDNADIQRIIRDYYEQMYGSKISNLEEMDRFLEKLHLPRLSQEEIEIMKTQLQELKLKL